LFLDTFPYFKQTGKMSNNGHVLQRTLPKNILYFLILPRIVPRDLLRFISLPALKLTHK